MDLYQPYAQQQTQSAIMGTMTAALEMGAVDDCRVVYELLLYIESYVMAVIFAVKTDCFCAMKTFLQSFFFAVSTAAD